MSLLQKGIDEKYIKLDDDNKYITYLTPKKRYRFNDPEEKVRGRSLPSIDLQLSLSSTQDRRGINRSKKNTF
jgi:hypothetical protein